MRIIRRPELHRKTGYSVCQIDRLEAAGQFPARIKLGPQAVGWLESEVDEWIKQKIAERDRAADNAA